MQTPFLLKNSIGIRTILKTAKAHRAVTANRSYRKILIDGKTKLNIGKSAQIINNGYLSMGITQDGFFPSDRRCRLQIADRGKLFLNGSTVTGPGVTMIIGQNASIELGHEVCINSNATLIATEKIKVGDGSGIGWDTEIIDTDFHSVIKEGMVVSAPVEIGSHVYIARRVIILKGVKIGDGSVIASGSIVTKDIPERCLAAGSPARVIRENVQWEP